jgi:hypothetical protein
MIKLAYKNPIFREKVVREKKVNRKNQAQVVKEKTSITWTRLYYQ